MKTLVDSLDSVTGWTVTAPTALDVNEIPGFIAGYNSESLMILFDAADPDRTAEKAIGPIDVTGYNSLVISAWSQQYGNDDYRKQSDYKYTISLAVGHEITFPIKTTFTDVTIPLQGITEITRIKITALHGTDDAIVLSEAIAERQEMPEDALTAVKDALRVYVDQLPAISLGTANASVGDNYIAMVQPWVTKYTCVKIDDGVNSEIHQLGDRGDGTFKFLSTFDGKFILNDFVDATMTLYIPVTINPGEQEILLPGIVIWGFTPEPFSRSGRMGNFLYAFDVSTGNAIYRREGQQFEQSVFIDIEGHQHELISKIARAVKKYVSTETAWINGRKHEVGYEGAPIETQPPQGVDIVSSLRIIAIMEYTEQTFEYVEQAPVTVTNVSAQEG